MPTPSSSDYAMVLDGVSKRYFINPNIPWRLRDLVTSPRALARQLFPREPFWAVRDVSLSVHRGEVVGIIGSNGSGKSTLLRMMVGLSPPTAGHVSVHGRYAALLELGAGFHPQSTGRENAYLNALFMGLPKAEAKRLLPEIIEFSGLGAFADQPVRTYSSGMYIRLAFSVAIHVRPEILVIDEVLAVGDAAFQQKCFEHFAELKERLTTIVMVTHSMPSLIDYADRVVLMEHGQVKRDGLPQEVVEEYMLGRFEVSPLAKKHFQKSLIEHGYITEEQAEAASPPQP